MVAFLAVTNIGPLRPSPMMGVTALLLLLLAVPAYGRVARLDREQQAERMSYELRPLTGILYFVVSSINLLCIQMVAGAIVLDGG